MYKLSYPDLVLICVQGCLEAWDIFKVPGMMIEFFKRVFRQVIKFIRMTLFQFSKLHL